MMFFVGIIVLVVGAMIVAAIAENKKVAAMPPQQRARYLDQKRKQQQAAAVTAAYGARNSAMVCPHCTEKGQVHVKQVTQKKGVSGGKATGALLTGGVSLLATGLSRKENNTQAHCANCNNTWFF